MTRIAATETYNFKRFDNLVIVYKKIPFNKVGISIANYDLFRPVLTDISRTLVPTSRTARSTRTSSPRSLPRTLELTKLPFKNRSEKPQFFLFLFFLIVQNFIVDSAESADLWYLVSCKMALLS